MTKYKIGVTESGDAGLDLSWTDKLDTVDGAIVITKCVAAEFIDAVRANMDKLIVHATITGYGHSVLEPNVPPPYEELEAIMDLMWSGFPKDRIVVRVDPIVPTEKGIRTALNIIKASMDYGFSRFRVSIIDMYPHVRERFKQAGIPLPYGEFGFQPGAEQVQAVDKMLKTASEHWKWIVGQKVLSDTLRIESCAEPGITAAIKCGCISDYDLKLLGLTEEDEPDSIGFQRGNCLCYSGKTELLRHKKRCGHGCLYCYWK